MLLIEGSSTKKTAFFLLIVLGGSSALSLKIGLGHFQNNVILFTGSLSVLVYSSKTRFGLTETIKNAKQNCARREGREGDHYSYQTT